MESQEQLAEVLAKPDAVQEATEADPTCEGNLSGVLITLKDCSGAVVLYCSCDAAVSCDTHVWISDRYNVQVHHT